MNWMMRNIKMLSRTQQKKYQKIILVSEAVNVACRLKRLINIKRIKYTKLCRCIFYFFNKIGNAKWNIVSSPIEMKRETERVRQIDNNKFVFFKKITNYIQETFE